jgi:hypothetical protein
MSTEFYIWYRVDSTDRERSLIDPVAIETAARKLIHELHFLNGVSGRLLKREDEDIPTWMEHYALQAQTSSKNLSPSEFEAVFGDLVMRFWPSHFPKRYTERFELIELKQS